VKSPSPPRPKGVFLGLRMKLRAAVTASQPNKGFKSGRTVKGPFAGSVLAEQLS